MISVFSNYIIFHTFIQNYRNRWTFQVKQPIILIPFTVSLRDSQEKKPLPSKLTHQFSHFCETLFCSLICIQSLRLVYQLNYPIKCFLCIMISIHGLMNGFNYRRYLSITKEISKSPNSIQNHQKTRIQSFFFIVKVHSRFHECFVRYFILHKFFLLLYNHKTKS